MQESVKTLGNEENILPNQAAPRIMQKIAAAKHDHIKMQMPLESRLHEDDSIQNSTLRKNITAFLNVGY